ncbi:UvrD-helicase domain-containing protein [Nocardia acidivorans]|uniref:UvrD-helicase domain-containing protein n=1 Tax=Nocardia acidivorans TaxID=404580 RepID=UPI000A45345A|nr:UvrD-helicase domain-containing protein [Nocardia acidivorans]
MQTQVLMHELFQRSYDALDKSITTRVVPFMLKLQQDPDAPGLDLKQPKSARNKNVRTARINDQYRAVLLAAGGDCDTRILFLVAIKKHDAAYDYAASLTLQVNAKTGAVELFDASALDQAVDSARQYVGGGKPMERLLLESVRQKDLERFGIDPALAAELKAVTDEDALERIVTALPSPQGNAVLDLVYGKTADEVWRDLVVDDPGTVDVDDIEAALRRPLSRLSFIAVDTDNADELRAMLEGDFAKWRVWLHPLQRKLATHTGWNGPFRVTGGAGTGKTVTAVHRARFLGHHLRGSRQRVLFTTFTKNLARAIEDQLMQLAGRELLDIVDVVNIDALARRVVSTTDIGRLAVKSATFIAENDSKAKELWSQAVLVAVGSWTPAFLADEWSQVVLGNGISDETGYLRVPRTGRVERLTRAQRCDVWHVMEQFERLMSAQGLMTFTQLAARAAANLAVDPTLRQRFSYQHAVIDEAQDLHPAHWRLIRALVPPGIDDLFIVGDAHQRIYGKPVPLSRCGIDTRGRSRRLTINYRTSKQIHQWCLGVVEHKADDLDLDSDTFRGARSVFDGPALLAHRFSTNEAEFDGIAETLFAWNAANFALADIAVLTFERRNAGRIHEALTNHGIPAVEIDERSDDHAAGDCVRVMTMHRAKGLEFRAVILAQLGADSFPPPYLRGLAEYERRQEETKLRCLLYVAGSRAREGLGVYWTGVPSELLSAALESVVESDGRSRAV